MGSIENPENPLKPWSEKTNPQAPGKHMEVRIKDMALAGCLIRGPSWLPMYEPYVALILTSMISQQRPMHTPFTTAPDM